MAVELRNQGFHVRQQQKVNVYYAGQVVGEYFADLFVQDAIIVQVKAAESICESHEAQLINYLRATKCEVGLLLNFGKEAEFRRKIFTNDKK